MQRQIYRLCHYIEFVRMAPVPVIKDRNVTARVSIRFIVVGTKIPLQIPNRLYDGGQLSQMPT